MAISIDNIQKTLDTKDIYLKFPEIAPTTYTVRKIQLSPCKVGCPIDTDVKAYLGLIAVGKFEKALEVVKSDNPLPGICGRICVHPCETECNRNEIDQSLAICSLKRFLADYELKKGRAKYKPIKSIKKEKIAIIGSGPAGLTAANDLIRLGYKVSVFEELPVAGGMLYTGIPEYRLPRNIIKTEIKAIKELGVKIKTNAKIKSLNKLQKQGYNAIFLAIGAHKGLKLGIPGEDEFEGFLDCITFLRAVNLKKKVKIGKKVIVIGGGNAAIDSARTALRLGSDVHIVYRRSRKEMPANEWEIEEAEKEGVKIHYLASPIKILGEKGKVVAVECIKNKLGPPDASGRRRPVPIKRSEFKIEVNTIIPAISQQPDISFLPKDHGLEISKWNSFVVDEETLATNIPGIFAGGDCVTGPKTVIEAIAAGHSAAKSIDRYLQGKPLKEKTKLYERVEYEIVIEPKERKERIPMRELSLNRRKNFREVELGLTKKMAIEESERCLRCGFCAECSECTPDCDKRLVALSVPGDTSGMLLRVPIDHSKFPLNGSSLQGKISWADVKEVPVIVEPITAKVISDLCRGCGDCEEVCEYSAPKLQACGEPTSRTTCGELNRTKQENGVKICSIEESLCKGCGVCASICPSGAITMNYFSDTMINSLSMKSAAETKIVAFVCNWAYPMTQDFETFNSIPLIRVMCSGRITPDFILKAFMHGADGVIGIGCSEGKCHYINGNETAEKNFEKARNILYTLGIEPNRVKLERLSPDEPEKFKEVIGFFIKNIKKKVK